MELLLNKIPPDQQNSDREAAQKHVDIIHDIIQLAEEHKNLVRQIRYPMLNCIYATLFGQNATQQFAMDEACDQESATAPMHHEPMREITL